LGLTLAGQLNEPHWVTRLMFRIIDLFAGPGGLGEGFSAWRDAKGRKRFQPALSIEKDAHAHATLRLRAFRRQFEEGAPRAYERFVGGEISWEQLRDHHPRESAIAEAEAIKLELSRENVDVARELIAGKVSGSEPWVLIGGPPCQAYSLIGRARNKGNRHYIPELDHRQTLYVEYLQILADHAPAIFVMENVKGLLSAQLASHALFDRIRSDLEDPSSAVVREGRRAGRHRPSYALRALAPDAGVAEDDPGRYLVRAERFGVPQRRHRVILLGVRCDLLSGSQHPMKPGPKPVRLGTALRGLPRLRSGLSREEDSDAAWWTALRAVRRREWLSQLDRTVRDEVRDVLDALSIPEASRGRETGRSARGEVILNHKTRSHMRADLERYLFAASFARVMNRSPVLADFPRQLLPLHTNVRRALGGGLFADRFRVQLRNEPATTVTSHIAKDGHYYIHHDPSQCRSLTVREAARLQTFPEDYLFCGPRTEQFRQVGNAVPPLLAEQIAEIVAGVLDG
jgi:DNA (cytosine-5)-methyltransferase 1